MKTPEAYYAQAREMFFTAHADFQAALDELTESDARHANMSLRQLREWHAERIYAAFLRQKNLDGMIFSIQLAEPDKAVGRVLHQKRALSGRSRQHLQPVK